MARVRQLNAVSDELRFSDRFELIGMSAFSVSFMCRVCPAAFEAQAKIEADHYSPKIMRFPMIMGFDSTPLTSIASRILET